MELDWSTFFLEILNFLVLVWLLRRFLYRPVLAAITRRQESVRSQLDSARTIRAEAAALQNEYENRISSWQQERDRQLADLDNELQALRRQRMEELDQEITEAREKAHASEQRRLADSRQELEAAALKQGTAFASSLLSELAGPELEQLLVDRTIRYLRDLPETRWQRLQEDLAENGGNCQITSAFELKAAQKQAVSAVIVDRLNMPQQLQFQTDSALICGLEILLGSWAVGANLRDELNAFAEHPEHD